MKDLRFDGDFVAEAVLAAIRFAADRGASGLVEEYESERAAALRSADAAAALVEIHRRYFKTLGVSPGFEAIVGEFPVLRDADASMRVGRAYGFHEEGPCLACGGSGKSIFLRIQSCRLFNHGLLQAFLRHCLLKASDMIDPAFGYTFPTDFGGRTAEENEAIGERFEDLWGASVASRLGYRGHRSAISERASVVFFSSEPKDHAALRPPETQEELISEARRLILEKEVGR